VSKNVALNRARSMKKVFGPEILIYTGWDLTESEMEDAERETLKSHLLWRRSEGRLNWPKCIESINKQGEKFSILEEYPA